MPPKKRTPGRGKTANQQKIPGAVEPDVKEIDDIAEELSQLYLEDIELQNRINQGRARMHAAMESHDRTIYEYGGVGYNLEPGRTKLKMKRLPDKD